MDAAVRGDRLPEVTQKPFLGLKQPLFAGPALRELESARTVSILCETLPHYPQSAFQGSPRVAGGGQQQFATQTLRVHLLGLEITLHNCYMSI